MTDVQNNTIIVDEVDKFFSTFFKNLKKTRV